MNGICQCTNPIVTPTRPPCVSANCFRVSHFYVKQIDSIHPCNETLVVDLSNNIHFDTNQLKTITTFEVISHSPNLKNVFFTVSPDRTSIEITMTSNYTGPSQVSPTDGSYKFATITFKGQQGKLSDKGTVTIPFRSHCNISIPNDKYCDICNGNLISIPTDISVEGEPQPGSYQTPIDINVN